MAFLCFLIASDALIQVHLFLDAACPDASIAFARLWPPASIQMFSSRIPGFSVTPTLWRPCNLPRASSAETCCLAVLGQECFVWLKIKRSDPRPEEGRELQDGRGGFLECERGQRCEPPVRIGPGFLGVLGFVVTTIGIARVNQFIDSGAVVADLESMWLGGKG